MSAEPCDVRVKRLLEVEQNLREAAYFYRGINGNQAGKSATVRKYESWADAIAETIEMMAEVKP